MLNIKPLKYMALMLLSLPQSPSFGVSYTLEIPTNLNLNKSGSFEIGLSSNNLSENEILNINIDDTFTLSDSHGKADISGNITNNEICFTSTDSENKTIYYVVNNSSCGDWSGNLNLNIELESTSQTNTLLDGVTIQKKLNRLRPTKIIFSHEENSGTYVCDLSIDGDESISMYRSGTEITITNNIDEPIKANTNMSGLFKGLSKVTTIEHLDYLDTSSCTDMSNMFYGCYGLTSIDVSSFDVSNVTNMSGMFANMNKCTSIGDISSWDVSNVTSFEKLFYCDYKLDNYGDLGNWNVTNNCTNLSYMFALSSYTPSTSNSSFFKTNLDLSNWDVSSVTNMSYMFQNAFNLTSLNINTWNCYNVTNMDSMFNMADEYNTSLLTSISGIDNLNISTASKTDMFNSCNNLSLPSWYQ